ncbi:decaprenyl-phosphate phosphoribosyltransferase [Sphaerisporangium sp. NPDC051017]|uniref:decaprenyl-phosphate phosphoribosyltransferase n=1 Tax=Sphaerisporangium sp. NPDC051017 TaxID=3154636 RepID=UPI00343B7FDD
MGVTQIGPNAAGTSLAAGLLRTARPRQWSKNLLVAAAPVAAGTYDAGTLRGTGAAFLIFCVAASAVYFLNDVVDVRKDRLHPVRRLRPIAAGTVPERLALVCAALLALAALGLAAAWRPEAAGVVGIYLLVNTLYCLKLKHVVIVELATVASGFLLRAVFGGVMAGLPLSQWFLIVVGAAALFMVAGKRFSELVLLGPKATATRPGLEHYSADYLRFVWQASGTVAMTTYCLWAFELPGRQLTVVPLGLAFLRYGWHVDRGEAGEPESVVLRDPWLLGLAAVWIVLFVAGTARG